MKYSESVNQDGTLAIKDNINGYYLREIDPLLWN